ncbi:hypothetical protein J7L05_10185 [bacterium]|nr:hypothetical protein [bacterium]
MNALVQEILKLREDVEELKQLNSTDGSISKKGKAGNRLEHKLGRSFSQLIGGSPSRAIRPWLNAPGMKRNLVQWLGFSEMGFASGLIGGLWSLGVSAVMKGISNLFKSNLAPLLKAHDPEAVHYVNEDIHTPYFKRSYESELIRGKGARGMMRGNTFFDGSLERQIRRGVVGL